MRVFVAGATGAIGVRLVPRLVERGHEVIGTSRSPERANRLRAWGAEPVVLDLLDPAAVRRAVGAQPPFRVPRWLARLVAGEAGVVLMTEIRGASNAKAKRELGWTLRYPSWRQGFRAAYGGEAAPTAGQALAADSPATQQDAAARGFGPS
jgi:nucleoside-diphosphate-sugar epimerase